MIDGSELKPDERVLPKGAIREFVSNSKGAMGVIPSDCEKWAKDAIHKIEQRELHGDNVAWPSKVWPEQWMECAKECPGKPFRVWLSIDSYLIFRPLESNRDKFTTVFTVRGTGDIVRTQAATIEEIGVELQRIVDDFLTSAHAEGAIKHEGLPS